MKNQKTDFDFNQIITEAELESLIDSLIGDAEDHPYAIYGLMFVFSSILKLVENDKVFRIDDLSLCALRKLYSISPNIERAVIEATKNIHQPYRAADFTVSNQREIAAPFILSEYQIKDSPASSSLASDDAEKLTGDLEIDNLALALSSVLNHPQLPEEMFNGIAEAVNDTFNNLPAKKVKEFTRYEQSPEYLAKLIKIANSKLS